MLPSHLIARHGGVPPHPDLPRCRGVGEVSPSTPLALFCPASHTNFNDSDFYSLLLPFPAFDRSHRRLPARTPRTPCFSSKRFISERWFSGPGFKVITRIFGYSNSRYAFSDLPGAVPAVALTTIIVRTIPIVTRPRTLHVDASTAKIFPDLDPDWIVRDEVFKRGYQSYYPVAQDNRGLTDPHTPQLIEGALSKAVDIAISLFKNKQKEHATAPCRLVESQSVGPYFPEFKMNLPESKLDLGHARLIRFGT